MISLIERGLLIALALVAAHVAYSHLRPAIQHSACAATQALTLAEGGRPLPCVVHVPSAKR